MLILLVFGMLLREVFEPEVVVVLFGTHLLPTFQLFVRLIS